MDNLDNIKLGSFKFYPQPHYPRRFFFIALMSIAFVMVVPSQHTTDRSVILKNFMERQNQRDTALKYLIPCTATFIEEYFEYSAQISFLLPDVLQDVSAVVESLMNKLRVTSAIYTLNVNLTNVMETYDALANVVILSESGIVLEANNSSFINYCEHDCSFIIVLTNQFTDKESFLIEADTLVQQLRSIFKLEILASVGDSVLLASSLPVRTNESYALAEPTLSGRCEQKATVIRWQRFANQMKSLFDTSIVNAAMFSNFPFTFFVTDTNYSRFDGVEGLMVEEIARSMKIKLNREMIEWMPTETTKTELYLRFYNATNDLIFGGLLWDFSRKMTYTTCYGMVHISWIIPIETNISLRGLIAPFNMDVWYAIICVLIVGGLIKLFFIRDITFLHIAALILGVPVCQPTKASSRILFISWSVYGFFITQLYLGSLAHHLISTSDMQIESMEELANSGLKIGGTQRFADLLETPDKADMDDNVGQMIRENFLIFQQHDYNNQFLDLVEGRNTSLALLVMLNLSSNHRLSNIGHGHIIKENVGSYPLAFVTRQGFPYLREFNFKIQVLVQAGLVEFWSNMAILNESYHETEDQDSSSKIDINDITPAFLLLIIGYLGGCCLLIIEVIFYPSKLFL